MNSWLIDMAASLHHLELTEEQERFLIGLGEQAQDKLMALIEEGAEIEQMFSSIARNLERSLNS